MPGQPPPPDEPPPGVDLPAHGPPASPGSHDPTALMRAALAGSGTLVWEWDLRSDALDNVDTALAALGYPPGAIAATQDAWNALIHPDDLASNHAAWLRHEHGEVDVYEHAYRVRAADGRWRWVRERGRVAERDGDGRPLRAVGTQTDITDLHEREELAQQAQERLAVLVRHVPGALVQFRVDTERRVTFSYASERCGELFGIAQAEFERDGRALLRWVDPADVDDLRAAVRRSARTLKPWRAEFRIRRRDGALRWVRGEATPRREADGACVWHGYLDDVTDRRELEQARQDAAVAAAANRAKTEFLSRMSHELRTPLNAVLGFTQLLQSDPAEPPTPGQQRRLKLMREAGEHLLQMIADLLDLTRIESGGLTLEPADVALAPLVAECFGMLAAAATKAGVTLVLVPEPEPGAAVHADRTRLRQVLLNLLTNAVKYNRPGGRVEVEVGPGVAGRRRIAVRDTGIGLSDDDLAHLYEPFFRGRRVRGRVDGTGIGLALTRDLAAMMGGSIAVDSSVVDVGTTFGLTLPDAAGGLGDGADAALDQGRSTTFIPGRSSDAGM